MSSGFVTETEALEARKRRQEEWEKVRTPEQPLERPEEPYDGRSLYDRLKEQKTKKDMDYEEAHKLKNLIRGLDDDEVQFLELVDQSKIDAEKKQMLEEEQELKDFRNRVATLQEESADKKIQSEIAQQKVKTSNSTRQTQKSLLGLGIKRKNGEVSLTSAASTSGGGNGAAKQVKTDIGNNSVAPVKTVNKPAVGDAKTPQLSITTNEFNRGQFKCIAVLPGIGPYTESSDSEISSGSEEEPESQGRFDLVGRKRQKKKCNEE